MDRCISTVTIPLEEYKGLCNKMEELQIALKEGWEVIEFSNSMYEQYHFFAKISEDNIISKMNKKIQLQEVELRKFRSVKDGIGWKKKKWWQK